MQDGAVLAESEPAAHARFTVRGRLEDPGALTWRAVADGGPVSAELLDSTVVEALDVWQRTGVVAFSRARDGDQPSVTISWHAAERPHDSCRPFGSDLSVAHSGPFGAHTFIHLDASHDWSAHDDSDDPLGRTLRHEIGHVIGLDHCADEAALMSPATRADEPKNSDLAGLHSLYGGYHDGPGDITIEHSEADTEAAHADMPPRLRRVAPPGVTRWTLLDSDGDGKDELLVWRTDAASMGALMIYVFGAGARLERTLGPLLGVLPPESSSNFLLGRGGDRWIVTEHPDGRISLRRFDAAGLPQAATPQEHLSFDRDNTLPVPMPETTELEGGAASETMRGDLDGDGQAERLVRRTAPG